MSKHSVSVVIPNWNGVDLLSKNLPLVIAASHKNTNIVEIIVCDDGSTDGSADFIQASFPQVKIVRRDTNGGFSKAVNDGVAAATGELVCLLNSDVSPNKDFLISTTDLFDDPNLFGVSLHETGFGPAKGFIKNGFVEHGPLPQKRKPSPTFWVSGGSAVFKRSIWNKLEGLDADLYSPFYWEDIDICFRAMKRGHSLLWDPDGLVNHEHETTVKRTKYSQMRRSRIVQRNQLRFIWKNITSRRIFIRHIKGLVTRLVHHPGYSVIVFFALLKIHSIVRSHVREARESKISDESIFSKFQ